MGCFSKRAHTVQWCAFLQKEQLLAGVVPDGVSVGFLAVVMSSGSDQLCFAAIVLGVATLSAAFAFRPSETTKSSSVMLSPGTVHLPQPLPIADATLLAAS